MGILVEREADERANSDLFLLPTDWAELYIGKIQKIFLDVFFFYIRDFEIIADVNIQRSQSSLFVNILQNP